MNVQETLYNQTNAEIRQGEDSDVRERGITIIHSSTIETLKQEAEAKYPYPKPCCRLKKMHIDGLREAYVKRRIND